MATPLELRRRILLQSIRAKKTVEFSSNEGIITVDQPAEILSLIIHCPPSQINGTPTPTSPKTLKTISSIYLKYQTLNTANVGIYSIPFNPAIYGGNIDLTKGLIYSNYELVKLNNLPSANIGNITVDNNFIYFNLINPSSTTISNSLENKSNYFTYVPSLHSTSLINAFAPSNEAGYDWIVKTALNSGTPTVSDIQSLLLNCQLILHSQFPTIFEFDGIQGAPIYLGIGDNKITTSPGYSMTITYW